MVGIFLYTIVQIWYDKYYENTLFEDKSRLYNLLVFVTLAQSKGMSRDEIRDALRKKGWTSERINFVIKKANGERTGLYEVIPISRISAFLRKKKTLQKPERWFKNLRMKLNTWSAFYRTGTV